MTTPPDIGGHGWDLLWAGLVVAVLTLAAYLANRGRVAAHEHRGGLIHGYDKRVSTSKSIAVLWTLIVAFMVLTAAFVALGTTDPAKYFSQVFNDTDNLELYLVLLGGPYAAAIMANVLVGNYVASGQVQRTDGDTKHAGDLISNENGATDPYDFQYVLFNLIAAVTVLVIFIDRPAAGAPEIPTFLAVLTGGSAATYATRKALAKNPPVITSILPSTAPKDTVIEVRGENLFLDTGDLQDVDQVTVTVGGVLAALDGTPTASRLKFKVPELAAGEYLVRVTTNLDATVEAKEQLTVTA